MGNQAIMQTSDESATSLQNTLSGLRVQANLWRTAHATCSRPVAYSSGYGRLSADALAMRIFSYRIHESQLNTIDILSRPSYLGGCSGPLPVPALSTKCR